METGVSGATLLNVIRNVREVNKPEPEHVTVQLLNMVEMIVCCQMKMESEEKERNKFKNVTYRSVQYMETGVNGTTSLSAILNVEVVNKPELEHVTLQLLNTVETTVCCLMKVETKEKKKSKLNNATNKSVQLMDIGASGHHLLNARKVAGEMVSTEEAAFATIQNQHMEA